MKGRSSKHGIGRNRKFKQQPHLSAAYIRTLVKQLTSSRCANQPEPVGAGGFSETPPQSHHRQTEPPPQQHKKQVRRRVQTNRPYQERLVDMAEARREIVTALKLHRAAMKQANEQQQQQQQQQFSPPLNCSLPSQTLGLNLNFHGFNNIETNLCQNIKTPSICSSSSSSSTLSVVTEDVPPVVAGSTESCGGGSLHQAVDDEGMAEMRSLGEQHQMEWNDTMNLVTSAWWFKFLKKMELGNEFDQAMEFPACLNANDTVLRQHFNHLFPDK
ncbi:hypothetical protein like AT5G21280 [Hibiscus trionum]|uniref:Uncharacterized protein n=1 Tax=Hibiscus trionum TaxID=183268 RepID=A0A9W7MSG8_HIBTR|nr:hypothetical protein like AT5G21280 [Hibiscus trionum]